MLEGCGLAALSALGIAVTWIVAIIIGAALGPATMIAALIAAGIITAFTVPQLMRGISESTRRRRG